MAPVAAGLNPTESVNISFSSYLASREKTSREHTSGGVPDYAFDLDLEMRRRINAIPCITSLFKAITESYIPYMRQQLNLTCVLCGPNQYPEIYEMGVDCARRLGIGIPQIYVKYEVQMNAFAVSIEDAEPVICVNSSLIQNMTPGELKTIIGHECGHIHNLHGVYNAAAEALFGAAAVGGSMIPGAALAMALITGGARLMFMDWSRCAEITCDRAGMICADDPKDSVTSQAKFGFGGVEALKDINIDEYVKQIDVSQATVARMMELGSTHPVTHKRIQAVRLFQQSDALYQWRPEWKTADMLTLPKAEVDRRCRVFIDVFKKAKKKKEGAAK